MKKLELKEFQSFWNRNFSQSSTTISDNHLDVFFKKRQELFDNRDARKNKFMHHVAKFKGEYPDEMLREFFLYWSEHGENDRKFRMEKQKSFNVSLRLKTWQRRSKPTKATLNERVSKNLQGW